MCKIFKNGDQIVGVLIGTFGGDTSDIPISKGLEIANLFDGIKEKPGYEAHISMDDLGNTSIVYRKKETDKLTSKEIIEMVKDEILSSVHIDDFIPKKEGCRVVPKVVGNHVQWCYQYDPEYSKRFAGTYTDPIPYFEGMEVKAVTNTDPFEGDGWYTYEGDIKRCFKSGIPASFDDENYFTY